MADDEFTLSLLSRSRSNLISPTIVRDKDNVMVHDMEMRTIDNCIFLHEIYNGIYKATDFIAN
jgi:hypothetical protein